MTLQTHLWGRLFNRPLLVTPARAAELAAYMMGRAGRHGALVDATSERMLTDIQATSLAGYSEASPDAGSRDSPSFDGIATLRIIGITLHRLGAVEAISGMTSYDILHDELRAALDDPSVRGIFLEIDSPGGEVVGLFDLADAGRCAASNRYGRTQRIWPVRRPMRSPLRPMS